ncbi:YtxH domain-containing protein [Paenibacillus macerans]|uniref:YtxH domain-containing protein n=1 Tax=Paenibacillus TaxID=44249 RepID=UPI00097A90B7|nr:YtxH domain-containing protein [Paenibacillus macerans]MEC0137284.1 YtxH domain-containing protein [Paenibacillus macerans]OMG45761.1 general stress protein [Paenibacillus macerans]
MSKGNKGWLWGAAVGTIVGSVAALLFAPKPGRELRKDIADGARQVGEKTQEIAGKVTEQSAALVGKIKDKAEGIIGEIQARRAGHVPEEEEAQTAQASGFADDTAGEAEKDALLAGAVPKEES